MRISFVPASSPSPSLYCSYATAKSVAPASLRLSRRQPLTVACSSIPARDVVIDFGKFKGSKMGTLPSNYLRWLIREVSESRFDVWAKYAEEVLEDPHYRDRLEWESIEKLAVRGDMRKSGSGSGSGGLASASASAAAAGHPPGVKSQMEALGWDLSDSRAWHQVNFSMLGTSLGGRIPRKNTDTNPNPNPNPKPKPKSTPASRKATTSKADISSPTKLASSSSSSMLSNSESTSLSLREELQRRRLLRRERSQTKSSSSLPSFTENGGPPFPGRDSLLKRAKDKGDT